MPFVFADIAMQERINSNLLEHALFCTAAGGCISVELSYAENLVTVSVSNNGLALDETLQAELVAKVSPLSQYIGQNQYCLGLLVAKRMLQLHDSILEVNTSQGTTFRFRLPAAI